MLDEEEFSIKSFILKVILVVLFVVGLIWLFPMPDMKPVYNRIFIDNIETMRDAAKAYFTIDRLPIEIGESEKMTLAEMQSNNLVLPFLDSENNVCDLQASYVEVKKMEDEYLLKVKLTCPTKTDYIVEHLGCYNLCEKEIEEEEEETTEEKEVKETSKQSIKPTKKPEKQVKETDKQSVKTIKKQEKKPVYSYQFSKTLYKGYKIITGEVIEYEHEKYENKLIGYEPYCLTGTLVDGKCKVLKTVTDEVPAILRTSFAIKIKPFDTCEKEIKSEKPVTYDKELIGYSCSAYSGYILDETENKCKKTVQDGYTYGNWYYYTTLRTSDVLLEMNEDETELRTWIDMDYDYVCDDCYDMILVNIYDIYKRTKTPKYIVYSKPADPVYKNIPKCEEGELSLSGDKCIITDIVDEKCCKEGEPVTSGCKITTTNTYYHCDEGVRSGSKCIITKKQANYNEPDKNFQYKKTLVDVTWSENDKLESWEPTGETRNKVVSEKKVYTDWVSKLPSGYKQYKIKKQYEWFDKKEVEGWEPTGEIEEKYI